MLIYYILEPIGNFIQTTAAKATAYNAAGEAAKTAFGDGRLLSIVMLQGCTIHRNMSIYTIMKFLNGSQKFVWTTTLSKNDTKQIMIDRVESFC